MRLSWTTKHTAANLPLFIDKWRMCWFVNMTNAAGYSSCVLGKNTRTFSVLIFWLLFLHCGVSFPYKIMVYLLPHFTFLHQQEEKNSRQGKIISSKRLRPSSPQLHTPGVKLLPPLVWDDSYYPAVPIPGLIKKIEISKLFLEAYVRYWEKASHCASPYISRFIIVGWSFCVAQEKLHML